MRQASAAVEYLRFPPTLASRRGNSRLRLSLKSKHPPPAAAVCRRRPAIRFLFVGSPVCRHSCLFVLAQTEPPRAGHGARSSRLAALAEVEACSSRQLAVESLAAVEAHSPGWQLAAAERRALSVFKTGYSEPIGVTRSGKASSVQNRFG